MSVCIQKMLFNHKPFWSIGWYLIQSESISDASLPLINKLKWHENVSGLSAGPLEAGIILPLCQICELQPFYAHILIFFLVVSVK